MSWLTRPFSRPRISREEIHSVLSAARHHFEMIRTGSRGENPIFISTVKSIPLWDNVSAQCLAGIESALERLGE